MSNQLALFGEACGTWPYPAPCPIRDECGAHQHFTEHGGGCEGRYAICMAGEVAAGRYIPQWQWNLMSRYTRKQFEKMGAVVL